MLEAILGFLRSLYVFVGYVARGAMSPALPPEREKELLSRLAEGDADARGELIERNLRLVAHIAKKYKAPGRDLDDLIQIGSIGLIKAVNTYTPSRAKTLAGYAGRCLENEILMHLRSERKRRGEVSLEEPIGVDRDGSEITVADVLGTEEDAVFGDVIGRLTAERLRRKVDELLDGRERAVVVLRYGLDGAEPLPQREVGRLMGISRSYVSRIEKRALSVLREALGQQE